MTQARTAGFRPRSLDAVNFLLADVRGALGPYLNVFLVTQQNWSQSEVGLVTTLGGLLGLVIRSKRAVDAGRMMERDCNNQASTSPSTSPS